MKKLLNSRTLLATAGIAAIALTGSYAVAQTQSFNVGVQVQNTLTLTHVSDMNFGTIAAIGDTGQTASVAIGTDGTLGTPATTGGAAVIAIVDDALASAAAMTVEDGANGATLNVEITNVVDPTDGTDVFTLDTWQTSYNGGADQPRTADTPFTRTFDSAFGGGVNTMNIGATITTVDPSTVYADGAYSGSFDVVWSY